MDKLRLIGGVVLVLAHLLAHSQPIITGDSLVSIGIIGDKVCIDKKGNLNFSYFYQNKSSNYVILLDYYDPCIWENPVFYMKEDSLHTLGLFVSIQNDQGEEMLPVRNALSSDSAVPEFVHQDSIAFYEAHEKQKSEDYEYHTRVLKPKTSMINFFSLKLNKRKCFGEGEFKFDPNRKYTVRLHYVTQADMIHLLDPSMIHKSDHAFVGKVMSEKVELCFEKGKKTKADQ